MISETLRAFFNKWTPYDGPLFALGEQLAVSKTVIRGTYDFAVSGGAISTINLLDQAGRAIVLPNKAIVTQVYVDTITAPTSGGSATVSVDANSTGDLKAALAFGSYTGIVAGVPVGTAGTMVKLTAARTLTVSIATATLTAGKLDVFVEYVLSE